MKVFLTFDDGPDREFTPQLLDVLRENAVRATFFVLAESAAENPPIIARMKAEGHRIQLHANRHISAYLMTKKRFCAEMTQAVECLNLIGVKPTLYRPPWGHSRSFSAAVARKHGMKMIRWDVMAEDWKSNISSQEIAARLQERAFDGAVICLHDGRGKNNAPKRTVAALRNVLPLWIKRGVEFEILE